MQESSSEAVTKVLLVEDSAADARLVVERLAEHEGFAVDWVRDLTSAVAALAEQSFDAVLLDLLLPDARGGDLLDAVTGPAGRAAVIVLSGQASDDLLLARAVVRKGAQDFLPKAALTSAALARAIVLAVERRALRPETVAEPGLATASSCDVSPGHDVPWPSAADSSPSLGMRAIDAGSMRASTVVGLGGCQRNRCLDDNTDHR